MKTRIIAFTGRAGSGKDYIAQAFPAESREIVKFAKPIREIVCSVLGIDEGRFDLYKNHSLPYDLVELDENLRGMTVRDFMLSFNALRESISPYVYAYQVKKHIEYLLRKSDVEFIFVTDLRMTQELEIIKSLGGEVLNIDRPRRLGQWMETYGETPLKGYKLDEEDKLDFTAKELTKRFGTLYNKYNFSEKLLRKVLHFTETQHLSFKDVPTFTNDKDLSKAELMAAVLRRLEHEAIEG